MGEASAKKTVVITGGSTGIGLSIVKHLLQNQFRVINLARRSVPFRDDALENYEIDLTDRKQLAALCAGLTKANIYGFVHNAGLIRANLIEDVSLDDLDELNQLHLGAAIQLVQALIPSMKKQRMGRIVLTSSRAFVGMKTRTSYAATKAAQIALARTWALELGEFGITANTVAPGPIQATEMFHEVVPQGSPVLDQMAAKIPVRRLGEPDDVAKAVMFFIDEQNSFVTGQNLFVCGGTSIESG
ncbi:MAG: SDR family oxidoreductase [Gammaproteobacteria bacterium]